AGLGSPTNSQPGRLRYVAQASGLPVLAASSRQFWWCFQDAPPGQSEDLNEPVSMQHGQWVRFADQARVEAEVEIEAVVRFGVGNRPRHQEVRRVVVAFRF